MKRYRLTFDFFDTREEAEGFVNTLLREASNYYLRTKKISIQDWTSQDGTESKTLVWYYI